ncbi:hypothetical protein [uncultured Winogradskyella sp.]|uniref:hypothetical protein n=1 Tax=uncultured Winogradskyella sp. TaxID=395353 RepID=UPI002630D72E|nr:hypothetical protein [uncultured Winogradskyella sp.]
MKPTYSTSEGERFTTSQIERKMNYAKGILIDKQLQEHGYNFCTECERNDCKPLDCAHIISVKEAKETGRSELCWDINNMRIIGRVHHQKQDGLNLQFNDSNVNTRR